MDLKDVDRYEFYAGFLKSSAKITLVPKPLKRSQAHMRSSSNSHPGARNDSSSPGPREVGFRPPPESAATWVCVICAFSNPVPSNFDPTEANAHTPLPPCLNCGVKPSLAHVLKASISNANNRAPISPLSASASTSAAGSPMPLRPQLSGLDTGWDSDTSGRTRSNSRRASGGPNETAEPFSCPRCTFSNHPSLLSCEMCGAPLLSKSGALPNLDLPPSIVRPPSPGPTAHASATTQNSGPAGINVSESVKISFRDGGEKIFYERLKGSMIQRKWLLGNAPPTPKANRGSREPSDDMANPNSTQKTTKTAGIAGLEQRGINMHRNNEVLIGSAFEDLEALMASAKDVIALAERFARQNGSGGGSFSVEENAILAESANQLGLITTKDIVAGGSSESLYLSELSRNLAEFLTDDSRGVLKKAGGIITLVDLWAMFNRARGGVELVSPRDFEKAARLWEELQLPVRLRTFRSGVMVVQGRDRTDATTIKALLVWLQDLHEFPPEREVLWDWRQFGVGVTAHETAERFGWSLGVAEEELFMAEDHGALCREEGLEGTKFWKNYLDTGDIKPPKTDLQIHDELIQKRLKDLGLV